MFARLVTCLGDRIIARTSARLPDVTIGGHADPYLLRWWVIPRNKWFNIYLHRFLRSDDDRALHDHPWMWCSILLRGAYLEVTQRPGWQRCDLFFAGDIRFHRAKFAHRLEIDRRLETWTLFITGPVVREWGFHCPKGWRPWWKFVDKDDPGSIGPGCD